MAQACTGLPTTVAAGPPSGTTVIAEPTVCTCGQQLVMVRHLESLVDSQTVFTTADHFKSGAGTRRSSEPSSSTHGWRQRGWQSPFSGPGHAECGVQCVQRAWRVWPGNRVASGAVTVARLLRASPGTT